MSRLPPAKAIIALEAVVRTGGVSAAADELCVTHSAISKQIAQLEAWVGRPLFEPNRRQMIPTSDGRRLSEAAGMAWALIAAAVDEIDKRQKEKPLRVIAPATFAMRWLLPRLPALKKEMFATEIEVRQTHTGEDWLDIPFDVVIRRGGRCPDGFEQNPLMTEDLALVAKSGVIDRVDFASLESIASLPFLEAKTRPGELSSWLHAHGIKPLREAMAFPHFYIALEAALAGHGALVAPKLVVEDLLTRGDLRQVQSSRNIPGPQYWGALHPSTKNHANGKAFLLWLQAEAERYQRWAPDGIPEGPPWRSLQGAADRLADDLI